MYVNYFIVFFVKLFNTKIVNFVGTLIINILEYNDQSPEFLPHGNITIDEERPIGTFVMALLAKDQDDAIAEYSLPYNPNKYFSIGFQTGIEYL